MVDFAKMEKLVAYFKNLDPSKIIQKLGKYTAGEHCGCCVGAHIAHCLERKKSYEYGIDALYAVVYGSPPDHRWPGPAQETAGRLREIEKRLIFHGSGPKDPYGTRPWATPPHIVFQRLLTELREDEEQESA